MYSPFLRYGDYSHDKPLVNRRVRVGGTMDGLNRCLKRLGIGAFDLQGSRWQLVKSYSPFSFFNTSFPASFLAFNSIERS